MFENDFSTGIFDGAEAYYKKTLSIPMYYGLDDKDIETISDRICAVVNS